MSPIIPPIDSRSYWSGRARTSKGAKEPDELTGNTCAVDWRICPRCDSELAAPGGGTRKYHFTCKEPAHHVVMLERNRAVIAKMEDRQTAAIERSEVALFREAWHQRLEERAASLLAKVIEGTDYGR